MSHPPIQVKHPVSLSATPASSLVGITTSPAHFIPRREFIKDHRTASSFALLAFSGSNLLRLYSFTAAVISALRRLLAQKDLVSAVREHAPKHFYEFTLEGKPWANLKSISSEKLIVDILTVILHTGYAFLSTIDYGRESDDKVAIAFSRPVLQANAPPSMFPAANGSAISLNQPPKTPFAISFSSATTLRVIGPPLHSTPAILQAVRGAWPRGIESDRKVGDATYEFKLKGYKWFQEDTFPMDSLNHILGLLTSLDGHGFTLLTQLSFNKPSRVKDFWVFTGLSDDHSPPPTPTTSNHEPKRELTPLAHAVFPGSSPWSTGVEKRSAPRALPVPTAAMNGNLANGHARNASDPTKSSPLKQSAPPFASLSASLMRRTSTKLKMPSAFPVDKFDRSRSSAARLDSPQAENAPVDDSSRPPSAQKMVRSLSNPSSVGSVDMTGVGRRSMSVSPRSPDVFYVADGRQNVLSQEYNPFQASLKPDSQPPHAAFIKVTTPTDRRASMDNKSPYAENRPSMLRPSVRRSSTLPGLETRQPSGSSIPRLQAHAPSPISAKPSGSSDRTAGRDEETPRAARRAAKAPPQELRLNDRNRTPTPPLLTPGTFRDSAFSWATGKTQDASTWLGRDPELLGDRSLNVSRERDAAAAVDTSGSSHGSHRNGNGSGTNIKQSQPHAGAHSHSSSGAVPGSRPDVDRVSTGPVPPGGWVSTPREDRNDVSQYKMFPPTIREQPSQEGSEHTPAMSTSPKQMGKPSSRGKERERTIPEERINVHERHPDGAAGEAGSSRMPTGILAPKPQSARRDTAMSGWVMVNVEGSGAASHDRASRKSSSQSPPGSSIPAVRRRRSNSDSGLLRPQANKSSSPNPPPAAAMSAAVKSIAMIDAVEAKKEEAEKSNAPSGLRRMWHRAKGSEPDATTKAATLKRRTPVEKSPEPEQEDERANLKEKLNSKMRGTPPVTKPGRERISLD